MNSRIFTVIKSPLVILGSVVGILWLVALSTAEPVYKAPIRPPVLYSFPPKCPMTTLPIPPLEELLKIAEGLNLKPHMEGRYFRNQNGCCFTPGQVLTIRDNFQAYQHEMENYW